MARIPLVFLFVAAAGLAADILELGKLQAAYDAAMARATKPVIQAHILDLGKLRDTYARSTNLAAANKVQGDIDAAYQAIALSESGAKIPASSATPAAAEVAALELDRLRAAHAAAIARVTKPLTQSYLRELERLRDTFTRASRLDAALAVQSAIAAASDPSPGSATTVESKSAPGKPPRLSGKAPLADWFVGKTWGSERGTRWTFEKGGSGQMVSGAKKTPIAWKVLQSGLLEVRGESAQGSNETAWFMQIVGPSEGWYGSSASSIEKVLQPR